MYNTRLDIACRAFQSVDKSQPSYRHGKDGVNETFSEEPAFLSEKNPTATKYILAARDVIGLFVSNHTLPNMPPILISAAKSALSTHHPPPPAFTPPLDPREGKKRLTQSQTYTPPSSPSAPTRQKAPSQPTSASPASGPHPPPLQSPHTLP